MRLTSVATYVFLAFNVLGFVVLMRMNWGMNKPQNKKEKEFVSHLRLESGPVNIMTEDEYFRNEKRFSVVIVTHKETLLEKTYPG